MNLTITDLGLLYPIYDRAPFGVNYISLKCLGVVSGVKDQAKNRNKFFYT